MTKKAFCGFILAILLLQAAMLSTASHAHDRDKDRRDHHRHDWRHSKARKKPPAKLPVIQFTAEPQNIEPGQSVTLSWKICKADRISIDQGIGVVAREGSIQVQPEENTTYTITAQSCGKSVSSQVSIQVDRLLIVKILHPMDVSALDKRFVAVSGSISLPDAVVSVNGVSALVSGDFFIVENLSLVAGRNTLTVTAVSGQRTAQDTISVFVQNTDLEPYQFSLVNVEENERNQRIQGQAAITLINHGNADASHPFELLIFEDLNLDKRFDSQADNLLGQRLLDSGPVAGSAMDVFMDFSGQLLFRDNRLYVYIDSDNRIDESDETNNLLGLPQDDLDVSLSSQAAETASCFTNSQVKARIGNAGSMTLAAATKNEILPGAYEDIQFQWPAPACSAGGLIVANDDGSGAGTWKESNEENNQLAIDSIPCQDQPTTLQQVSGLALDAVTGSRLGGVQITLKSVEENFHGSIMGQISSNSSGDFGFDDLPAGDYRLSAVLDGYEPCQRFLSLKTDQPLAHQDLVLSPLLSPDQVRIILTWGESPADLEAHVTAPNSEGCRHHCFYWKRQIPGAELDHDAMHGYGPETITLTLGGSGTFRYYVHDFSNRLQINSRALSQSQARVTVYFGTGKDPLTFHVPDQPGNVWHALNIDASSGRVDRIDRMADQAEPAKIDFPRIVTTPPDSVVWGIPYMYTPTAVDPDDDPLSYRLNKAPQGMTIDPASHTVYWEPESWQAGWHEVELLVSDGRCGEDAQRFKVAVSHAPLAEINVDPCSGYNPGGQITLSWATQRADKVKIEPDIGAVEPSGSLTIDSPATPTYFTLVAENTIGRTVATIPDLPSVAIGERSQNGQKALYWQAECAINCSISPDIGSVPCNGTVVLPQIPAAEYTLTADNGRGEDWATVLIKPECSQPDIEFETDAVCRWAPGDPLKLKLRNSECLETCVIEPGVGPVACDGSFTVNPQQPTTYTLKASGKGRTITTSLYLPQIKPLTVVAFGADRHQILPGEQATLTWQVPCADSCALDSAIGPIGNYGSTTVTPEMLPQTYTLTALRGEEKISKSITFYPMPPEIAFYALPGIIKPGESAELVWSVMHADTCRIEPDIGPVALTGRTTLSLQENTNFRLIAEGPGGTQTKTASISFVKPFAQIQADPQQLEFGKSTTLTWIFANADTCIIEPDIGEVQLGGSRVVTPQQNTTYTIFAKGPGGKVSDSVIVAFPPPQVTISAEPQNVFEDEKITLNWQSQQATSCTITPDLGRVDLSGTTEIFPKKSLIYTIVGSGPGGNDAASVTVVCHPPQVRFWASSESIESGESATLSWEAKGASHVRITPLGQQPASGTIVVSPDKTRTYRLEAAGCGQTVTSEVTVRVSCPPSISIKKPEGDHGTANTAYILKWEDADCDDDAVIAFYYDLDNQGQDGELIVAGLHEDRDWEADQYLWDTTRIAEGKYYIYARIDDGKHEPVVIYSPHAITIDHSRPPMEPVILSAPVSTDWQYFGSAVAADGDTMVVAAPFDDELATNCGAVFVYTLKDQQWGDPVRLNSPDPVAYGTFGSSVALSDDILVVSAVNQQTVYIFKRRDNTWMPAATLPSPGVNPNKQFGCAVAVSGDFVFIGVKGDEERRLDRGAVYVFKNTDQGWSLHGKLFSDDTVTNETFMRFFGTALAANDDYLIVGTETSAYYGPIGAAYIFRRENDSWIREAKLRGNDTGVYDSFGCSVSISQNAALVGSWSGNNWSGAAYIFRKTADGWTQEAKLTPGQPVSGGNFGASVWLSKDHAYIGSANNSSWSQEGANTVHIFRKSETAWTEQLKLGIGDNQPDVNFGKSIATTEGWLIVGAEMDVRENMTCGLAHLYPLCTVDFAAIPGVVAPGGSVDLTWQTHLIDTVDIAPGLGSQPAKGRIAVTPAVSMTYELIATGPYGRASAQASVEVGTWSPIASLEAIPDTITFGESTTLTWESQYASELKILPDIGDVAASGSLKISPIHDTTYTMTATGPGGAAEASVTVSVTAPKPEAEISASPASIQSGESAILSWKTQNADAVRIDPSIGPVAVSGELNVSPQATQTYTVTANGPGGQTEARVTVTVRSPIELQILSPSEGQIIDTSTILVRGSFRHSQGLETGITINGIVAQVFGNQFAAPAVHLQPDQNLITVQATDSDGHRAESQVTVMADLSDPVVVLSAEPASGIAPFETEFAIDCPFEPADVTLTHEGPGDATYSDTSLYGFRVRLSEPGLHLFTVHVLDDAGAAYSAETAVTVLDRHILDTLLKGKWNDMKVRLASGDIEGALTYHSRPAQQSYREIYTALSGSLPRIVQDMQDIELVLVQDGSAKYRIKRDEEIQGTSYAISYYLYFDCDEDGIWKLFRY
jgi:hypothetical protein